MAQAVVRGRVVSNLELKTSVNGNPYLLFSLAERIGYGETAHTQYYQVWAWGDAACQLDKQGVTTGSLIWVSGVLELVDYIQKDGTTKDKRLKITLKDWGAPPKQGGVFSTLPEAVSPPQVIDGERDMLPE